MMAVVADAALDQPVDFVRGSTVDATVSVASRIAGGGQIVPIQHLVAAMSACKSVRMVVDVVRVVGTVVAFACPYFDRHNRDTLESQRTSLDWNEGVACFHPSYPRIESFALGVVVRWMTSDSSLMFVVVAVLYLIALVCSVWTLEKKKQIYSLLLPTSLSVLY